MTTTRPQRKPRITLNCVGYTDHGVTMHTANCSGQLQLTLAEIEQRIRWLSRGSGWKRESPPKFNLPAPEPTYYDATAGKYRCGRCSMAGRLKAVMEYRLQRQFKTERIRSAAHRRQLMAGGEEGGGFFSVYSPKIEEVSYKKGEKPRAPGRPRFGLRMVPAWSQMDPAPSILIGLCLFCERLTLTRPQAGGTTYAGHWHVDCFHQWLSTADGQTYLEAVRNARVRDSDSGRWVRQSRLSPTPFVSRPRRRGPRQKLTTLKRHFAWVILNKLAGWSERKIARHFGVDVGAVSRGIKEVLGSSATGETPSLLPPAGLVEKRFQPLIRALN